jgi:hypothetical protein
MSYLTFISHSSEDTWVAKNFSRECNEAGAETFLDEAEIAIGANIDDDILTALRNADELVALITPWALKRSYIWLEIGAAWLKGIPIIVILHGMSTAEFQGMPNVPMNLKLKNFIPLNEADRYFKELTKRVNESGGAS